jgi:hypothetical protein
VSFRAAGSRTEQTSGDGRGSRPLSPFLALAAGPGESVILKPCLICARLSPKSRCPQHPKPPKRTGTYNRDAAKVRATATHCALCGEGSHADDPWVADHRVPRSAGGSDDISNLQPAHRSCNGRKGAGIRPWVTL